MINFIIGYALGIIVAFTISYFMLKDFVKGDVL